MKPPPSARLIRGHRLAQGLVGAWTMAANGGLQVFDLSENGQIGTFSGNLVWTSGKFGSSVNFPGGGADWIDLSSLTSYAHTQPHTYTAWVYPTDNAQGYYWIINNGNAAPLGSSLVLHQVGGDLHVGFFYQGGNAIVSGSTHVPLNTWSHIAAVSLGQTVTFYVNGIFDETDATGSYDAGNLNPRIGAWQNGSFPFYGLIDIPSVYNRALSASEVAKLYPEPFCMFERKARTALLSGYAVPPVGNAGIMTTNTGFWGPTF